MNCFEADDFKDILNKDSRHSAVAVGEGSMRQMQQGQFIQIERKGFYFVDKLELGGNKITLNYTPDGKAKNDTSKAAKGGAPVNKAAANKAAAAAADGGEPKELSKKELNKLAKKEKKSNLKAGGDGGKPAGKGAEPKLGALPPVGNGGEIVKVVEAPKGATAVFDKIEAALKKAQFLGGLNLTAKDR